MTQKERDLAVLRENTALLSRRLRRETEKRLPLYEELAFLVQHSEESAEKPSLLDGLRRSAHELFSAGAAKGGEGKPLSTLSRALAAADCTAYINAYLALCQAQNYQPTVADLLPIATPTGARIAYVRNAYTDEAYDDFAGILPEPTVHYVDSFREACNEVVTGEANFCILPFRSSAGPLRSFTELAAHHSLYICALCRVFHADGTDVTHFALYGRTLLPPGDDAVRLRFSFLCPDTEMLAKHICAAAMLGVTLEDMTAEPYAASEGSLLCTATAIPQKERLLSWLAYLLVFTDGGTCHGLYKEI